MSNLICFQIGANAGIVGMTKEHLGLALALNVPVFVVVTKVSSFEMLVYFVCETTLDELEFILSIVLNQVDMCPPNVLQDTLRLLLKLLKSPGCRKTPVLVRTKDDVVLSATNFVSER